MIRAYLAEGSEMTAQLQYDSDKQWHTAARVTGTGKGTIESSPVPPPVRPLPPGPFGGGGSGDIQHCPGLSADKGEIRHGGISVAAPCPGGRGGGHGGKPEDTQLSVPAHRAAARYTLNHLDDENFSEGGISPERIAGLGTEISKAAQAEIGKAKIGAAQIQHLEAQVAKIVTATLGTAVIDWAQIKELTAAVATIARAEIAAATIGRAGGGRNGQHGALFYRTEADKLLRRTWQP